MKLNNFYSAGHTVRWPHKTWETKEKLAEDSQKRYEGAKMDLGLPGRTSPGLITVVFSGGCLMDGGRGQWQLVG